ncbi:hypothetical protein HDV00_001111 [Rhizophlyctis rosea]|nr:hypothetical protein HDV00_001111 [Rhizophlyctis rosea]
MPTPTPPNHLEYWANGSKRDYFFRNWLATHYKKVRSGMTVDEIIDEQWLIYTDELSRAGKYFVAKGEAERGEIAML